MGGSTGIWARSQVAVTPPAISSRCRDYRRMADTLTWISAHFEEQPMLADMAARAGASPCHFQRLFSRWVGLSPKKYVQHLTLARAKASLDASHSVLAAAFAAGLSALADFTTCS